MYLIPCIQLIKTQEDWEVHHKQANKYGLAFYPSPPQYPCMMVCVQTGTMVVQCIYFLIGHAKQLIKTAEDNNESGRI